MSEKKIQVPDGMLNAAMEGSMKAGFPIYTSMEIRILLKAALLWLIEHPIVPTDEQVAEMREELRPVHPHWANIVAVWQRRMFDAPEPGVPEEIKDLLIKEPTGLGDGTPALNHRSVNERLIEAYRRGQQSRNPEFKFGFTGFKEIK